MTRKQLVEVIFDLAIEWQNRKDEAVKLILKELRKED